MAHFIAHLTFYKGDHIIPVLREHADTLGWTFRDHIAKSPFHDGYSYGSAPYCGLSKEEDDEAALLSWMQLTANVLLEAGVPALHQRIVRVIYDSRIGYNEIVDDVEGEEDAGGASDVERADDDGMAASS